MAKIEFKPALFPIQTIIVFALVVFMEVLAGFLLLPRALDLYQKYPNDPTTFEVLSLIFGFMIGIPLVLLLLVVILITSKKIWIDNNFIYFSNKSFSGKWTTIMLNLKDITNINWREKRVFTGKAVIVYSWFVFLNKDNHTQETSARGWDFPTLKSLLMYIKGKYPSIKINTPIYRDSSEELSGINEFLEKSGSKA